MREVEGNEIKVIGYINKSGEWITVRKVSTEMDIDKAMEESNSSVLLISRIPIKAAAI